MMRRPFLFSAAALLAALLNLNDAAAQAQDAAVSTNLISAATLSGSTGRIAVNVAAGNGSTQANIAAVSVGGASTSAAIGSKQQVSAAYPITLTSVRSEIGADAFRGASGLISVNQSSGNANTQANLAAIAVGQMPEVSIEQLGHVRAAPTQQAASNAGASPRQNAVIADSAFAGARGIVQVNQLAGSGNSTANVFALSIGTGAGIQ